MIRLQHVSKVFGIRPLRVPALSDISFSVAKGEFVVLTGASGAGKTTLLRLLYRAETPSEGEIEVAGFDVTELRPLGDPAPAPLDRHRLPGLQAPGRPHRVRERGLRAPRAGHPAPRHHAQGLRRRSRRSGSPPAPRPIRTSSRRARPSGPPWRGPSSSRPACSWPTSPPATSTRTWRARSWAWSRTSGAAAPRCSSPPTRRAWPPRSSAARCASKAAS